MAVVELGKGEIEAVEKMNILTVGSAGVGKTALAVRMCKDDWQASGPPTICLDYMTLLYTLEDPTIATTTPPPAPPGSPAAAAAASVGGRQRGSMGPGMTMTADQWAASARAFTDPQTGRSRGPLAIQLHFWDTAGQERFQSLTKAYYRSAHLALLVYDVTSRESFEAVRHRWAGQIRDHCPPDVVVALVGNKVDLAPEARRVPTVEGRALAQELGTGGGGGPVGFFETSAKHQINTSQLLQAMVARVVTGPRWQALREPPAPTDKEHDRVVSIQSRGSGGGAGDRRRCAC